MRFAALSLAAFAGLALTAKSADAGPPGRWGGYNRPYCNNSFYGGGFYPRPYSGGFYPPGYRSFYNPGLYAPRRGGFSLSIGVGNGFSPYRGLPFGRYPGYRYWW